jgi:hypothetical protein
MCDYVERAASLWELWEELSAHTISVVDALPFLVSTPQNCKQIFCTDELVNKI